MKVALAVRVACWTLLLLAIPFAAAAKEGFADGDADAIQKLLDDKSSKSNSGMVIGLLDEHGSRVFSAGKLDNGSNQQVDSETLFELGSVTKVILHSL